MLGKLCDSKWCEVAALIGSFYDDYLSNPDKYPWAIDNINKYLYLGYVKFDKMTKFRVAYLETCGDESIISYPPFGIVTDDDSDADTNSNGYILLDHHDGFILKPNNPVEKYHEISGGSKAQGKIFVHMKTFPQLSMPLQIKSQMINFKLSQHLIWMWS